MRMPSLSQQTIVFSIFVLMFAAFSLLLPGFLNTGNMLGLLQNVAILGILGLGMAIIVIGRGIDISMVAVLAVPAGLILQMVQDGHSVSVAFAAALALALLFGLINGWLTAYAEVPSLFTTLASGLFLAGLGQVGLRNAWRVGPADRDYADAACVAFESNASAKALMPYAPARVRAARTAAGVMFTILRRGRRDADGWQLVDIPLGEDSEAYDLELLRNGAVVRTLTTTSPTVLYPSAQEAVDFGGTQTGFDIRAFQKSAAAGRGFPFGGRATV